MQRPYIQNSAKELEDIFNNSGSNPKVLRILLKELEKRKTASAVALRQKVETTLSDLENGNTIQRPYIQNSAKELEDIFSNSGTNPKVLRLLLKELEKRKTASAVALRQKVETTLSDLEKSKSNSP